ncbi:hypothetical protein, partial [Phocaeicola vulgatus]
QHLSPPDRLVLPNYGRSTQNNRALSSEESVKSIMTGDELQTGYATLEKSHFRIAKFLNFIPGLGPTDYSSNGYIDTSFHFMDSLAVHTRIFYLFTKVNYTIFHVSLCFNISYKDKKNNRHRQIITH